MLFFLKNRLIEKFQCRLTYYSKRNTFRYIHNYSNSYIHPINWMYIGISLFGETINFMVYFQII